MRAGASCCVCCGKGGPQRAIGPPAQCQQSGSRRQADGRSLLAGGHGALYSLAPARSSVAYFDLPSQAPDADVLEAAAVMTIAALVLPVFAVILIGWIAGASGYLPRSLAGPLVQFAYNVAM